MNFSEKIKQNFEYNIQNYQFETRVLVNHVSKEKKQEVKKSLGRESF